MYYIWKDNENVLDATECATRRDLVGQLRDSNFMRGHLDDDRVLGIVDRLNAHGSIEFTVRRRSNLTPAYLVLGQYDETRWNLADGIHRAGLANDAAILRDKIEDWINDEESTQE